MHAINAHDICKLGFSQNGHASGCWIRQLPIAATRHSWSCSSGWTSTVTQSMKKWKLMKMNEWSCVCVCV